MPRPPYTFLQLSAEAISRATHAVTLGKTLLPRAVIEVLLSSNCAICTAGLMQNVFGINWASFPDGWHEQFKYRTSWARREKYFDHKSSRQKAITTEDIFSNSINLTLQTQNSVVKLRIFPHKEVLRQFWPSQVCCLPITYCIIYNILLDKR